MFEELFDQAFDMSLAKRRDGLLFFLVIKEV